MTDLNRPRAETAPAYHLIDTTMMYAPRSGGVKRYLTAKRAWLVRGANVDRYGIDVVGFVGLRLIVERVGLDDIGAGFEVGAMDALDELRLRQDEHFGAVLEVAGVLGKPASPIILLPELVGQVSYVSACTNGRGDPVVGVPLQVIDVVLSGEVRLRESSGDGIEESQMAVGVDNRRHDGLASQIDARRACRELHVTVLPDARELAVLDDECGIVDGATVADNQPRAVEQRDAVCRTRLAIHLR